MIGRWRKKKLMNLSTIQGSIVPLFHRRRRSDFPAVHFSSPKSGGAVSGCPMPPEQQPINEYRSLSTSFPFSWASAEISDYRRKLLATGSAFAVFAGLPVCWLGSVHPESEPLKLILGSACSGLFAAILVVLRMYLGWAYVGNRLMSAAVEYEETGWYDGEIWVKTGEILARDRLLGSFTVKPVVGRLKKTLVILGGSLFLCAVLLFSNYSSLSNGALEDRNGKMIRGIPGVYSDESARNFEPDAFCGGGDAILPPP
ncbi:hypothetical protein M569_17544 [Genlisea aurea]|uniref:DUF1230 family protein n=1 Tax=Genlisea aurea TaxID=192259 RepID=S8BYN4_9LAMI|nr:hypothetical protein M569_17544 [Genlisea aurea]